MRPKLLPADKEMLKQIKKEEFFLDYLLDVVPLKVPSDGDCIFYAVQAVLGDGNEKSLSRRELLDVRLKVKNYLIKHQPLLKGPYLKLLEKSIPGTFFSFNTKQRKHEWNYVIKRAEPSPLESAALVNLGNSDAAGMAAWAANGGVDTCSGKTACHGGGRLPHAGTLRGGVRGATIVFFRNILSLSLQLVFVSATLLVFASATLLVFVSATLLVFAFATLLVFFRAGEAAG